MSRTIKRNAPKFRDDLSHDDDFMERDSYWDRAIAIAEREATYGAASRTSHRLHQTPDPRS
ncbi:hypothetical protein ACFSM5_13555 [Lacibacterium aquatile]|uniref:Uncharacterized protein n=1 Tax=Lacibacterium aquatile TaxID=1168082 RepID=A0ABW5DS46_9PROT